MGFVHKYPTAYESPTAYDNHITEAMKPYNQDPRVAHWEREVQRANRFATNHPGQQGQPPF